MELLRGVLSVASTHGQGSLFFCALPVTLWSRPAKAEQNSFAVGTAAAAAEMNKINSRIQLAASGDSASIESLWQNSLRQALILIVDDSTVNLRLTRRKLQLALGDTLQVKLAEDGLEAIAFVKSMLLAGSHHQIAAILMDYHMPKCSGKSDFKLTHNLVNVNFLYIVLIW